MRSKVKLIIDKDLGHVVGVVSAMDAQRSSQLQLAEVLAQEGLLMRHSPAGELRLPEEQIELYDVPVLRNVKLETIIERPRLHIYEKNPSDPEQSAVFTPNKQASLDEANTEETVVNLHTTEELSSKIRAKAYAQPRAPDSTTQILATREVVVIPGDKKAFVPLNLSTTQIYDVLVLIDGFSALLIEGVRPTSP